jgi:2-amino-4-hydroxy-6-hydroxymethyldihydropteridine pyrophosphokinase
VYQTDSVIALGSNLGNSIYNLGCAIKELRKFGYISKIADVYISKPYGYKYQDNFYNTAVLLKTNKQPLELINIISQIEKKLKKNKRIINGPRNIDIDIIFYGKNKYFFSNLIIPHPRAKDRDFVLLPILDINPFIQHPTEKKTIKTLSAKLQKKYIIKKLSYRNLI